MREFLRGNGLSVVMLLLFALTLAGQILTGHQEYNDDQDEHGRTEVTLAGYVASSRFRFESFQNWQSEFLSVASIVLLSELAQAKGVARIKAGGRPAHGDGQLKRV